MALRPVGATIGPADLARRASPPARRPDRGLTDCLQKLGVREAGEPLRGDPRTRRCLLDGRRRRDEVICPRRGGDPLARPSGSARRPS